MALLKTTILPTDDGALACKMMREWIETKPHVLWVTMGDDADAQAPRQAACGVCTRPECAQGHQLQFANRKSPAVHP